MENRLNFRGFCRILTFAFVVFLHAVMVQGCSSDSSRDQSSGVDLNASNTDLIELGREITAASQGVLLANVAAAMRNGGPQNAIGYCNLNAYPLLDSISKARQVKISRVTNRYRNPGNRIDTEEDKRAWRYYVGKQAGQGLPDTILTSRSGTSHYYRPIRIGMETCLQCHGSRSTEIALETLDKLDELYPRDMAVNYRTGDLRGLWRVDFE